MLPTCTCTRCAHVWVPRVPQPRNCPNCHSPYWNRERVRPVPPKKEVPHAP